MKICTITCHDVYNHGASLQAYALMRYLEKCGHEVEIIDYKPDYLSNHYNLLSIGNPKWEKNILTRIIYLTLKIPTKIPALKRKKAFDYFNAKYLKITKTKYTSNNDLLKNIPSADAYICGSDQIWNSLHRNGKDPSFYLDFVPDGKIKASYAASFATDTISNEIKPTVKERVQKLTGISVREKSGKKILMELDINNVVNVVDPVFLLERNIWDEFGIDTFNEKYVLVYDFDNSNLIKKIAIELKKNEGYKIYSINPSKQRYADKYFKFVGPETFVALLKNAEYIISNSYHAAVFSIIYEKDFIIVNRNESINTRMRDLLDDLKLNERLVDEEYKYNNILKRIEYPECKEILNKKIFLSKKYLNDVLSL
jgi:hypothetical protein